MLLDFSPRRVGIILFRAKIPVLNKGFIANSSGTEKGFNPLLKVDKAQEHEA